MMPELVSRVVHEALISCWAVKAVVEFSFMQECHSAGT